MNIASLVLIAHPNKYDLVRRGRSPGDRWGVIPDTDTNSWFPEQPSPMLCTFFHATTPLAVVNLDSLSTRIPTLLGRTVDAGLVVWWSGELYPEGWDRARREVVTAHLQTTRTAVGEIRWREVQDSIRRAELMFPVIHEVIQVCEELIRLDLATHLLRFGLEGELLGEGG